MIGGFGGGAPWTATLGRAPSVGTGGTTLASLILCGILRPHVRPISKAFRVPARLSGERCQRCGKRA